MSTAFKLKEKAKKRRANDLWPTYWDVSWCSHHCIDNCWEEYSVESIDRCQGCQESVCHTFITMKNSSQCCIIHHFLLITWILVENSKAKEIFTSPERRRKKGIPPPQKKVQLKFNFYFNLDLTLSNFIYWSSKYLKHIQKKHLMNNFSGKKGFKIKITRYILSVKNCHCVQQ